MAEKELAVIKDVGYGLRDVGRPVLWFSAYTSESGSSLQVLSGEEATAFIVAAGVHDVRDLDGKVCWVQRDGAYVNLVGFAKI